MTVALAAVVGLHWGQTTRFVAGMAASGRASAAPATPVTPAALTGPCPTDPLAPARTPRLEIDTQPDATGRPARYGTPPAYRLNR